MCQALGQQVPVKIQSSQKIIHGEYHSFAIALVLNNMIRHLINGDPIIYCMELVRQCFQEKAITSANKALVPCQLWGSNFLLWWSNHCKYISMNNFGRYR